MNGVPHGKGIFESHRDTYYADRVSYNGEWQYGLFHGEGKMKEIFVNTYRSYTYEGTWEFGLLNGQATCTTLTNKEHTEYSRDSDVHVEVYSGEWEKNKKITNGNFTTSSFPLQFYRDEDIVDLIEVGYFQYQPI